MQRRVQFLNRLRRVTSGAQFIPEIDGVRCVAIVSVVVYHLHGYLSLRKLDVRWLDPAEWFIRKGWLGVPIFFVLSGFVLGLPFARAARGERKSVSTKAFFLRRLTRIEPAYIAMSLAGLAYALLFDANVRELLIRLGATLFYCHDLVYGAHSVLSPVFWTLELEAQFYVLVPLLARLYRIQSHVARRLAFLAVFAGFTVAATLLRLNLHLTFFHFGQFFLTGMILADGYKNPPAGTIGSDLLGLLGLFLLLVTSGDHRTYLLVPICGPWCVALFFYGALYGRLVRRILQWDMVTIIGGMCYSIYLTHFHVIWIATGAFRRLLNGPSLFFAVLLSALGVAMVFFVLIERPTMIPGWHKRLAAKIRAAFRPASLAPAAVAIRPKRPGGEC